MRAKRVIIYSDEYHERKAAGWMPGGVAEHIDAFRVDDDIHEFSCWMTKEEGMKLNRIIMQYNKVDKVQLDEVVRKAMGMSDSWFCPVTVELRDTKGIIRVEIIRVDLELEEKEGP
jgi:hypothetical protein